MTDWCTHWEHFPGRFGETEFLKQVGKTLHGQPISAVQFQRLIDTVATLLDLGPDDRLLDLCCGNGYLTSHLARRCRSAVGVDYSRPLIEIARRFHQPPHLHYYQLRAETLGGLPRTDAGPFTRILCYEALQHFSRTDLPGLLQGITEVAAPNAIVLLGSIPERSAKWQFYNTPGRRLTAFWKGLFGRDPLGTWWDPEEIARVAETVGWSVEFFEQPKVLHTAHYRFDARLVRGR